MIPVLNLQEYSHGNKLLFAKQLGEAYEDIGFVGLEGHFLNNEDSSRLYHLAESFFSLPLSVKMKYHRPSLFGQRGYTPFGTEHAKNSTEGDLKEFWQFGPELDSELLKTLNYPANVVVDEFPEFLDIGQKIYTALLKTGREVLKAIALYLKLDLDFFESWVISGNSILRPIHYPPIEKLTGNAIRSAEHEDINLITLLMGASADGLQVLDRNGHWIDVKSQGHALVVNVGDMLQRLTNNRLRSTTHRVINTPEALNGKSRYSIPFFLHPQSDMPLNCLPVCVSESMEAQYSPILAGDYLDERLREIGLK